MKYCTFKYQITYEDGNGIHGHAPYRGTALDENSLKTFVKSYFAGPKSYDDEDIEVEIDKTYDDPKEWISEIRNWETFKYLSSVNNFGGELIAKIFSK